MFANKLKEAMREEGLNLTALSAKTGIGKSSISQYLSGKNEPPPKRKSLLATALGKEPTYFDNKEDPYGVLNPRGNLSVRIVAKLMGVTPMFLYMSLRQGSCPFGFAAKMPGGTYKNYISPKRFRDYTGIDLGLPHADELPLEADEG